MTFPAMYESYMQKANILIEALPYIQRLSGKTVVIKYGGNAMVDAQLTTSILQDIALLKCVGVNPIVVHGGGPEINGMLGKLQIQSRFHNGLRVTDADTMEVVQMVLAGKINKDIVSQLGQLGVKAVGLCGKDACLLETTKEQEKNGADLGLVGQVKRVNTKLLRMLTQDEYVPVIAPVGVGPDGESHNVNADTVAGEVAAALSAEKLMFLTDIDGVYLDVKDPTSLIPVITVSEIHRYIEQGILSGGMIPKVQGCIRAVEQGVRRTHIINGTIPHPIVLEIFTNRGIGTMVCRDGDTAPTLEEGQ